MKAEKSIVHTIDKNNIDEFSAPSTKKRISGKHFTHVEKFFDRYDNMEKYKVYVEDRDEPIIMSLFLGYGKTLVTEETGSLNKMKKLLGIDIVDIKAHISNTNEYFLTIDLNDKSKNILFEVL